MSHQLNCIPRFISFGKSMEKIKHYYFCDQHSNLYLTQKEIFCFIEFCKNKTTKEIARDLNLSPVAVKEHFDNMLIRLSCKTRKRLKEKILASNFLDDFSFGYSN